MSISNADFYANGPHDADLDEYDGICDECGCEYYADNLIDCGDAGMCCDLCAEVCEQEGEEDKDESD